MLFKYNMYYTFVIFLFPLSVFAAEMDNCTQLKIGSSERNMCMAVATVDVNYCEKLTKAEQKISCTIKIRDLQRSKVQAYRRLDDTNTQKR